MKIKIRNNTLSLLILLSLFVPLFSDAWIMVPDANVTIIVNTEEQDNNFDFSIKSWIGISLFSSNILNIQTSSLTGQDNSTYITTSSGSLSVIEQTLVPGFKVDNIFCTSDNNDNVFFYQNNKVRITAKPWSNITCIFNNKKVVSKTPVLIVPGIMGTEMFKDTEKLWPDTTRMMNPFNTDSFMDPLAFNENLNPIETNVTTGQVLNRELTLDYTEGLKNEFIGQGYVEGETLFTFPYDWRYGVSGKFADGTTNVDMLKNKIESILAQTGKDKIDVVAHSMGGLLTKKYVVDNQVDHKINKAVFVGVPNTGAPEAIKTLIQGSNMDIPFLNDAEVKKISQNMPGAYDLLPSQTYYDNNGSFVKTIDYSSLLNLEKDLNYQESKSYILDTYNLNQTAFTQSEALHTSTFDNYDLKTTGIDLYNIVGCKNYTMTKFVAEKTNAMTTGFVNLDASEKTNGDSTVPIASASSVNASTNNTFYALKTKHSNLLSFDGSRQAIVNLIAGSNQDVGNNLITKAVLDADPNKCKISGWFFGLFSPVSIEIIDQNGKRSGVASDGSIQNDIFGASYEIIGNHKFIFIPNDENQTYTINLKGEGTGTYTFINSQITNEQTTKTESFINLPVTASLTGTVNLGDIGSQTTLTVKETPSSQAVVIYPGDYTPDTIPPEVIIEFDPIKKDLKFTGKDNVSKPNEIIVTDKDDTITLTDKAGNITEIKLKNKNRKKMMMAEIKSITYNGKLADTSKNQMIFRWYYDKQNNLKTLYQYAKQKSGYNISFIFDGRNTKITGKDILIRILKIEKGLKILKITTDKGDLSWSY